MRRYFLFTVVGALITEREAVFFSIGDGLISANDRLVTIGPYPDNAPPYLAYSLIPFHHCADASRFTVHLRVPTPELDRFVLGTDGATPLLDGSLTLPGKYEASCLGDRWWEEDLYYTNPAALTKRLRVLATDFAEDRLGGQAPGHRLGPPARRCYPGAGPPGRPGGGRRWQRVRYTWPVALYLLGGSGDRHGRGGRRLFDWRRAGPQSLQRP